MDGVVRLPVDKALAYAVLTGTQLDKPDLEAKLSITDQLPPGQEAVQVTFDNDKTVELQGSGGQSRSWLVPTTVSGLTPNLALNRFARVQLGGKSTVISYILTNKASSVVDFTIAGKPTWNVDDDASPMEINVQAHDQPIVNFQIAQSTLTELAVGTQIGAAKLLLCAQASAPCTSPLSIAPQTNRTAYLLVAPDERPHGIYKGNISFMADGRAEPKVVEVTLQSSSRLYKFLGFLVITVGVVWAWLVNVYWKLEVMRLTALQTATMLRENLDDLIKQVRYFERATRHQMPALSNRLSTEAQALTEQSLAPALPSVDGFYKQFDDTALKAALNQGSVALKVYSVIVRQGLEVVTSLWKNAAAQDKNNVVNSATPLDDGGVNDESAAHGLVDGVLLQARIAAAGAAGGGIGGGTSLATPPLTSQSILVRLDRVNTSAWFTYTVLVIISGVAVLILRNPGFGTWLDFVYCLFWGFGLPTTADKLQQVSATNVSSSLSVSMPK